MLSRRPLICTLVTVSVASAFALDELTESPPPSLSEVRGPLRQHVAMPAVCWATMLGRRGSACRSERLPPGATDTGGGVLAGPPAGLTPLRKLPPSALPAPGRLPPPSANVLRAEDDERERIKPYRI